MKCSFILKICEKFIFVINGLTFSYLLHPTWFANYYLLLASFVLLFSYLKANTAPG